MWGSKTERNMAIDLVLLLTLRLDRKNKLILGLYARISLTKAYWTWRVGQTNLSQTFHLIYQTHLGPKNKQNMTIDLVLL